MKPAILERKYKGIKPLYFSPWLRGVKKRIKTKEKILVLTLDACGGPLGNGFDKDLFRYLANEKIPSALFLSGRWMKENLFFLFHLLSFNLSLATRSFYLFLSIPNVTSRASALCLEHLDGNNPAVGSHAGTRQVPFAFFHQGREAGLQNTGDITARQFYGQRGQ